jgi:riboflavin kinase/FMN adenylyltransferase
MFFKMDRVFDSIAHFGREWQEDVCLALGMFDGVHRGHQVVLNHAVQEAVRFSGTTSALTFPKHPASLLRPGKEPPLIMTPREKAEKLFSFGLSSVIMQPFDQQLSEVPADQFIGFLKKMIPGLRSMCVGKNFRFGKNRAGDSQSLIDHGLAGGINVQVAESLILDDLPVSSSRIREALSVGDIKRVNQMLGRNYQVSGTVISGKALGRTIGFPTLNLSWSPEAKPAYGVYAGWAEEMSSGNRIPAIANYGIRPTLEEGNKLPLLEIHCLEEPNLSLWRHRALLSMELSTMIRPEKKFADIEELKSQIKRDCDEARKLFTQNL